MHSQRCSLSNWCARRSISHHQLVPSTESHITNSFPSRIRVQPNIYIYIYVEFPVYIGALYTHKAHKNIMGKELMRTKFVHLYIYIYECTWIGNCIETVPCHTRLHNGTKCRTVVFLLLARQLAGTSTCIFIHKNKRLGWVHLIVRAAQQTELTCIAHTIFQAHRAPHFSLAHTHTHPHRQRSHR